MGGCSSEDWFSGLAILFQHAVLVLFGVGVEEETSFFLLTLALVGGILNSKCNKLVRKNISTYILEGRQQQK